MFINEKKKTLSTPNIIILNTITMPPKPSPLQFKKPLNKKQKVLPRKVQSPQARTYSQHTGSLPQLKTIYRSKNKKPSSTKISPYEAVDTSIMIKTKKKLLNLKHEKNAHQMDNFNFMEVDNCLGHAPDIFIRKMNVFLARTRNNHLSHFLPKKPQRLSKQQNKGRNRYSNNKSQIRHRAKTSFQ